MLIDKVYRPLDLRNSKESFLAEINTLLLQPKHKVCSKSDPVFGCDDGLYDIGTLSSIFTKEYQTHEVIISEIKNCLIGPRPEGLQRYWPILFNNNYLWNFLNTTGKDLLEKQGVIQVDGDKLLKKQSKCHNIKIPGRSIWLHLFSNIDHLYRESLPTIIAIKEIYGSLDDFNFIIPHSSKIYIDILERLGICQEKIIQVGNTWLEFESVVISSFHSFGHLHTPSYYYSKLCEALSEKIACKEIIRPKKIFVSRKNAKQRRLVNEDILYDYMNENGFFICDPGDYSLEEQIEIFSEAEIVIGSHGMGIANCAFSRKLNLLIEIMPITWNRVSYYRTTQLKDCSYACYWINTDDNNELRINKSKFITFLNKTLENASLIHHS